MPRYGRFIGSLLVWATLIALTVMACSAADLHRKRADRFFTRGLYAKALPEYRSVMEKAGPSFDVHYSVGVCHLRLKEYAAACEAFEQARALQPDFPDTYAHLAACYGGQKRMDKATAAWEALLAISPEHVQANLELGGIYYDQGRYSDAEKCYRAYLKQKPDDVALRSSLGASLIAQKRYEGAIQELKTALAVNPKYLSAHYNLGVAYLSAGRTDDALRSFIVVTEMSPAYQEGWVNLAATYCRQGDGLRAIDALARAKENGFTDWARIEKDGDFRIIVNHLRYRELKLGRPIESEEEAVPVDDPDTAKNGEAKSE